MARSTILDRFRPAGVPGPAGPVGVPATGEQGPAAELAPVFAALAADVKTCRKMVEEAQRDADGALSSAREQAAAIMAQTRLDEGAERASAAERGERAGRRGCGAGQRSGTGGAGRAARVTNGSKPLRCALAQKRSRSIATSVPSSSVSNTARRASLSPYARQSPPPLRLSLRKVMDCWSVRSPGFFSKARGRL
jgi:hypothetical protein